MKSLRFRLMAGTAAATVVVFVVAAFTIFALSKRYSLREFDAALLSQANTIARLTELDDETGQLNAEDALRLSDYQSELAGRLFEIRSASGQLIARSHSLGDTSLVAGSTTLPNGTPGRLAVLTATAHVDHPTSGQPSPPQIHVIVGGSTAPVDQFLSRLKHVLISVCCVATASLVGCMFWVIRRGLSPLDRIAREIAAIRPDDLRARVDQGASPTELSAVVSRLNDLLSRVGSAMERERCFTADAAHELRTPLAGLQTALEVAASQRRAPAEYEAVARDCLKVVHQMRGLIEALLILSRAELQEAAPEMIDLGSQLHAAWKPFANRAQARQLVVEWKLADGATVQTDVHKLRIILNNLLENAVTYVDESGQVRLAVAAMNGDAIVSIANTGSAVKPEDSPRVFDRFWRGDESRSGTGSHFGLGLSLSRKLADSLNGSITAQSTPDGIFKITLSLPRQRVITSQREPL